MERAMLFHFRAERWDKAAAIAKDLAPYRHPRLAALTVKGDGPGGEIPLGIRFTNSPPSDAASPEGP